MDNTFERVKKIIVWDFGYDEDKITMESYFVKDIGIDSLDFESLCLVVDEEFEVYVDDEFIHDGKVDETIKVKDLCASIDDQLYLKLMSEVVVSSESKDDTPSSAPTPNSSPEARLVSGNTAPAPKPATPAPAQSSGGSPQALKTRSDGSFDLIGTVWALEHGDGNRWTFLEGGVVKHSLSDNNSWDQKGNSLTIKRDDGYLMKMEVVDSYTMKGTRKYKGDIFPSKLVLKRKS